jgi:hypothetical protein
MVKVNRASGCDTCVTLKFYLDRKDQSPRCPEPDERRDVLHKISEVRVLSHLDPALVIGLLICSMLLVIAFEVANGFHGTANAIVTKLIGDWRYDGHLGSGSEDGHAIPHPRGVALEAATHNPGRRLGLLSA